MIIVMREAIRGMIHNKMMVFVTMSVVAFSLIIMGAFSIATVNGLRFVSIAESKIKIEAFLEDGLTKEDVSNLTNKISKIEGISNIRFISKDEAYQSFKRILGKDKDMLEALKVNPLPASLEIDIDPAYKTINQLQKISSKIALFSGVEDVSFGKKWIEKVDKIIKVLLLADFIFGIILLISSVLLVTMTVRLNVEARRDHIDIMRLVGATDSFIKIPFIIEGLLTSLISSIVSAGVIYGALYLLSVKFKDISGDINTITVAIFVLGLLIGIIGSKIAVDKYLKESV
ncbi:ABC transporter permease [candidate division WOR-3 bacterium]|nr:ABC transporter permease [candidate division WOR-3 bacterium]